MTGREQERRSTTWRGRQKNTSRRGLWSLQVRPGPPRQCSGHCGEWNEMKAIDPGDIGLTKKRQQELIGIFKSVVSGGISPLEFITNLSFDPTFTTSDRVFLAVLTGGNAPIPPRDVWDNIGVNHKREGELKAALMNAFSGKVYISTRDFIQFILSEPGLSDADRIYLAILCGGTYEPSKGFEGT